LLRQRNKFFFKKGDFSVGKIAFPAKKVFSQAEKRKGCISNCRTRHYAPLPHPSAPKSPKGDFGDPAEVPFRGFRSSRQIQQFEMHPKEIPKNDWNFYYLCRKICVLLIGGVCPAKQKGGKRMEKRKRILMVISGCVISMFSVFAQSEKAEQKHWYIGLEGGRTYNMLYSSTGYRAFTEYQNKYGWTVGIPVRYQFFDWFALQTAFQYVQKNHGLDRTKNIHSEWTNSYLELPLLTHFSFGGKKLRGFLNTGGYIGFWADNHIKGSSMGLSVNPFNDVLQDEYESYDEKVAWNSERDNRFEAGLLAGVGIQYAFSTCTIYAEGRFNYGLTDMQKDYMSRQVPKINDTIIMQLGVLFNTNIFGGRK
jgi:hypothetical protein